MGLRGIDLHRTLLYPTSILAGAKGHGELLQHQRTQRRHARIGGQRRADPHHIHATLGGHFSDRPSAHSPVDHDRHPGDGADVTRELNEIGLARQGTTVTDFALHGGRRVAAAYAKAHYDGIVAFSQTDFTEDLKSIKIPVLVMHGDDDQIVPYENAGVLSARLLQNSTLKIYPGFPHGMPTTNADTINADLLAFVRN